MTLIFDRRNELQGGPGLHALIAGVSSYPHLPGGTGTPAPARFSISFFYFVGHGIQSSSAEATVLLENFGDSRGPLLSKAVSINNLFDGMAPSAARQDMALTQLYFIDASRVLPRQLKYSELQGAP